MVFVRLCLTSILIALTPLFQLPIGFIGMVIIPTALEVYPKWVEKLTQCGVTGGQCSSDGEVDSGKEEVQDDKDDGSTLIGDE